jgi:hypothetical protein
MLRGLPVILVTASHTLSIKPDLIDIDILIYKPTDFHH